MSENTIIFPVNLPEVQFLGKSQQKRDPSQNTNFASGQNRRRRLFGATPVYHEVRWVFTADQSRAFESFFENDLEGGSRKFLMQIDSVNGKDYQLFQFEEMYTGPDKIAGDAYVVSAKLIQFTFDKEYIEVRLPFTEVRSTDHTVSVVRNIGPDGAPDFDLSIGESGKVLIADYGITTFSEIDNALNDGKVVLLRIHPLPSTRQYALISSALGGQAFTFSRVTAEKLYTYTCTGLGWSQSSSDLGGSGTTYTAGDGVAITDSKISVNAGKGLGFDDDNKLEVKVGDGLDYDNDNKVITIDSDVSDVVATVNKLKEDLDQKITTTYPFAQITTQEDYAGFGVTNTSRMIGQLFAVPITSEIRKDETVLYVNALQNYSGDVSFGIFEYDFDGDDGSGSTYWIADTGKVTIQAGENRFPLLHVKNDIQELQSSKLYYAVIAIRGNAPSSGLYLASSPNYSTTYNANPKYTLLVSNMDQYIDWDTGSLTGAWFQGYNEDNNIPRLFMMLRNGGDVMPPIPITEPFMDIGAFTLEHRYKISNQFSLTPDATGAVYRKVIPLKDVDITSFRYVDYRGSVGQEPQRPVLLDDTYTPMKYISDGAWTLGDSDQTKIDGVHYVHEFTFNVPVQLIAGNTYWFMVGGNLGKLGESWMITYSTPSVSNDLLLVKDMYNVNSFIITDGFGEYIGGAPGMYLKLTDNNNNSWVI